MEVLNIFDAQVCNNLIDRINRLNADTQPLWGKMDVAKMLAHCNVTYEMAFTNLHPKPNFITKLILKAFVKNTVVNDQPYKKNSPTGPQFLIKSDKNFDAEKNRLIEFIHKVQALGINAFEGKESNSFGTLTGKEWNNMFYKHIDHHLVQFGV